MPRPCPPDFRARAIALVRAGKQAKQTAVELGIQPDAYDPKLDVDFTPLREQDLTAVGLDQAA
ncbi:hypothetical protein [Streptomyces sp. NPDC001537]